MSTSAIPYVIDALVTQATTALGSSVRVYDGVGVITGDATNYLMVGVDDPNSHDWSGSASSSQRWAHANGTARDEEGDITCAAWGMSGDSNAKTARDAAYAITSGVETMLRANPSLGVSQVLWTGFGESQSLDQIQDDNGAAALVIFTIRFRARL